MDIDGLDKQLNTKNQQCNIGIFMYLFEFVTVDEILTLTFNDFPY